MNNNQYDTLSQATNHLSERGYTAQWQLNDGGKFTAADAPDRTYTPQELAIVEYHRFEGESAPEDMSVVYAIEAQDGRKGTLVDAYGAYASQELAVLLKNIPNHADE